MLRVWLWVALAPLLSGCFVLDELDSGMEIMEKNSPQQAAEAKSGTQAGEQEGPPSSTEWWSKARSLDRGPAGAETDSGDPQALIRCVVGDTTRFTRRSNCLSQGGRPRG